MYSLNDPAKNANYTENLSLCQLCVLSLNKYFPRKSGISTSQKEALITAAILKGMTFCSFSERKVLPWVLLYWITVCRINLLNVMCLPTKI